MPGGGTNHPPHERFRELQRNEVRIFRSDGGWGPRIFGTVIPAAIIGVMLKMMAWPFLTAAFDPALWSESADRAGREGGWQFCLLFLGVWGFSTVVVFAGAFQLVRELPATFTRWELELLPPVRTATLRSITLFGGARTETLDPDDFTAVRLWLEPWTRNAGFKLAFVGLVRCDGSIWKADRGCDIVPIRRMAEDLAETLRLPLDEHGVVSTDHPD